jgi:hypothetical protein
MLLCRTGRSAQQLTTAVRTTLMTFAVSLLQLQLGAIPSAVARALALASGREPLMTAIRQELFFSSWVTASNVFNPLGIFRMIGDPPALDSGESRLPLNFCII